MFIQLLGIGDGEKLNKFVFTLYIYILINVLYRYLYIYIFIYIDVYIENVSTVFFNIIIFFYLFANV